MFQHHQGHVRGAAPRAGPERPPAGVAAAARRGCLQDAAAGEGTRLSGSSIIAAKRKQQVKGRSVASATNAASGPVVRCCLPHAAPLCCCCAGHRSGAGASAAGRGACGGRRRCQAQPAGSCVGAAAGGGPGVTDAGKAFIFCEESRFPLWCCFSWAGGGICARKARESAQVAYWMPRAGEHGDRPTNLCQAWIAEPAHGHPPLLPKHAR